MAKRKNKGMGISALLGNIDVDLDNSMNKKSMVNNLSNTVAFIPLNSIEINPFQPRVDFDPDALQELSDSIAVHGLIQPITVRHLGNDKFQLISGERRLRASKMAQLEEIPAFIRLANDQEMLEMALIENIQRQELNPIEVAITYGRLMKECNLTHKQLAERMGKGRATVTNFTRLLGLPDTIQKGLKNGLISMGHAKAIMGVDDIAYQLAVFNESITKQLSVRQVENLISSYKNSTSKGKAQKPKLAESYKKVQTDLSSLMSTKVTLKANDQGKGQIVINFGDTNELNRILDIIEKS